MTAHKIQVGLLLAVTLLALGTGAGVMAYQGQEKSKSSAPGPKEPVAASKEQRAAAAPADPEPPARARTFRSNLPFAVYQVVPGRADRLLGSTGPPGLAVGGGAVGFFGQPPAGGGLVGGGGVGPRIGAPGKPINVPAGAVWYVQPVTGFVGGGFGLGGGGAQFGGFGNLGGGGGGGGGAVGFGGGAIGMAGRGGGGGGGGGGGRPAANQPFTWGPSLTGNSLKSLVAEVRKASIPGLSLANMTVPAADLSALAKGAPRLRTLCFTGKTINDDAAGKLAEFGSLRLLRLEWTDVTAAGLASLRGLKSLARLELAGDKVDDRALGAVAEARSLTALRLAYTAAESGGLARLKSLPHLTTLELIGPFTDTDLKGLKELTGLKALRLHRSAVTDEGLAHLSGLRNLEALTLDGHFDTGGIMPGLNALLGGGAVVGLGGLGGAGGGAVQRWAIPQQVPVPGGGLVDVPAPQFTGKGLARLAGLPKLTELAVLNDRLADADLAGVAKFAGLTRLTIFAPGVGDKGVAHLKALKKLTALDLRGVDNMTTASAAALRELAGLKLLRANVLPGDDRFKARLAEWKRLMPRTAVLPGAEAGGGSR